MASWLEIKTKCDRAQQLKPFSHARKTSRAFCKTRVSPPPSPSHAKKTKTRLVCACENGLALRAFCAAFHQGLYDSGCGVSFPSGARTCLREKAFLSGVIDFVMAGSTPHARDLFAETLRKSPTQTKVCANWGLPFYLSVKLVDGASPTATTATAAVIHIGCALLNWRCSVTPPPDPRKSTFSPTCNKDVAAAIKTQRDPTWLH